MVLVRSYFPGERISLPLIRVDLVGVDRARPDFIQGKLKYVSNGRSGSKSYFDIESCGSVTRYGLDQVIGGEAKVSEAPRVSFKPEEKSLALVVKADRPIWHGLVSPEKKKAEDAA